MFLLSLLFACTAEKSTNTAPEAWITSPVAGSVVGEGASVTVLARVVDEESALGDLELTWLLDGEPATDGTTTDGDEGATLTLTGLSTGTHGVALVARDPEGEEGSDEVSFDVAAGEAPTVTFTAPADGEEVLVGELVSIEILVTDADSADLSDLTLTWGGDVAGVSGAPTAPTSAGTAQVYLEGLAVGNATASVTVTDTTGYTSAANIAFEVVSGDEDGDGALALDWGGTDCDDTDAGVFPGADEYCDGGDEDCDGTIDEDGVDAAPSYADADLDGFGDPAVATYTCTPPAGTVPDGTDCDDTSAAVYPGASEVCDGTDQDCDGTPDEDFDADADGTADCFDVEACDGLDNDGDGLVDDADADVTGTLTWNLDADGDGYGDAAITATACVAPAGFVADATDCDDGAAAISPSGTEVCDSAAADEDCDGLADDADPSTSDLAAWYADTDADGHGEASTRVYACLAPAGHVAAYDDCDDTDARFHPDATEPDCDDPNDYNCDGSTGYTDGDGDGWAACRECDDGEATTNPDGVETCDGVDQDCDGAADEDFDSDTDGVADCFDTETCDGLDNDGDGLVDDADPDVTGTSPWFADVDGDGFGDAGDVLLACDGGTRVADATDCDDTIALASPIGEEMCDSIDNDCDGTTDEDDAADAVTWYTDTDGDGFGDPATPEAHCVAPAGTVADGTDCDDGTASTFPGAAEYCDGHDDDCDGTTDEDDAADAVTWYRDVDADTHGDPAAPYAACAVPTGYVASSTDCDDTDAATFPGATEYCDGADDDCDGTTDEDDAADAPTWYADTDTDGFGSTTSTRACAVPTGYVATSTDCDDTDAATFPGATEYCDGADDDCDGTTDEDDAADAPTWYRDADADTYGGTTSTRACSVPSGYVSASTDCDDTDAATFPGATEYCDGADDDCDGTTDEDDAADAPTWYRDADADTYGGTTSTRACSVPTGYVAASTDCDDTDAASFPGATEYCDGADDDCDGTTDEDDAADAPTWYRDADADTYGGTTSTRACSVPTGYVAAATDCDDTDAATFPGATEYCDGADDDCDGTTDEDDAADAPTWYADTDADGYGSTTSTRACSVPTGYVAASTDCDDAHAAAFPGGSEVCDGLDNDCDGTTDPSTAIGAATWFGDTDDDTYGDAANPLVACDAPTGFVADATDCDDTTATTWPGATEYCNLDDDDCDGTVDEDDASDAITWYLDADTDGYGLSTTTDHQCEQPVGYVATAGECDDTDATVNPDATEVCDDVDQDCDGAIDDGAADAPTWYTDADADGYGPSSSALRECDMPVGYTATVGDCDDTSAAAYPGATETCNSIDDDCDGTTDEGAGSYYPDGDSDGYGDSDALGACTRGSGYVTNALDCDDTDANSYPGAIEVCDGLPNDCSTEDTWTTDEEAGVVSSFGSSGLATDHSATWNAGNATTSALVTVASNTYYACPGTYYVRLTSTTGGFTIDSPDYATAEDVILDASDDGPVITTTTGTVTTGEVTLTNGTYGIYGYSAAYIYGSIIRDNTSYGVTLTRSGSTTNFVSASDCTFQNNANALNTERVYITDCTFDATQTGSGYMFSIGDDDTFTRNTLMNNDGYGLYVSATELDDISFVDNEGGVVVNEHTATRSGVSATFYLTNLHFEGNIGHAIEIDTDSASGYGTPTFVIEDSSFVGGTGTPVVISVYNDNVTMDNCTFEDNVGQSGWTTDSGGISYTQEYNPATGDAVMTITNSTFRNNQSALRGGAIRSDGTLVIEDSTFEDNSISLTPSCNTFTYHCAGGAIYQTIYPLTLDGVTITGGDAGDEGVSAPYRSGGGLYLMDSVATMTDSTISGGNAYEGGGVYLYRYSTTTSLTMTDSLVQGNTASYGGGGFVYNSASISCTGSTAVTAGFLGNYASITAGGVYRQAGNVSSTSCDWGAPATSDDNLAVTTSSDIDGSGGRYTYSDDATF